MTGIEATDLDVLLGLLDLEQTEEDVFRGAHPPQTGLRTFGGQLVAQALVAAGRTTGDRPIHALNAHFIRGGNVEEPIEYRVARHRDGRDFANRMVTAYQGDEELFVMLAAYQKWGKGLEHAVTVPEVPYPEALPPIGDHLEGYEEHLPGFVNALKPIDMRYANDPAWILKGTGEKLNHNRVWMRTDGELPDDPLLHVAANHSIWFHRPPRFDQWHLYATESPVAAGSRGLATGRYFNLDGELVATVVQEGIIKHFPSRR
ncbi:acyl-CoA thioesterase II [Rhodococcus sp. CX]|uniref:acyl-CoA thioesterase n=1 Tax=Rhodococcus sp. CX TaxID=2789880 RepID=UPI0018CFBA93|nr:acyl-CoA thioesterase II [Rhodococcus sp. CX]MBH0121489.1 acyl-CoA thioesterase II [Rhodococcus sp. CX]